MHAADYSDFERLFKKHNKDLRSLAYNLVRDKDTAKDVVQEVFLKLWKNRENLNLEDSIKHYLFKATAHTALNHLRFSKKLITLEDDVLKNAISPALSTEANYTELELRVRKAVDKLPPKCKAIYILSRHEGLKYQEIADTLNLSLKTVENQMGIALEKLREDLKSFITLDVVILMILIGLGLFNFILKNS
jgi:RNA polymerase sigma-70 factor, ECF subfamily